MAPRILLCGDPLGRLNQLFKRVQSVSKSAGPFDALICVGQFFPDSPELLDEFLDYVEGRAQVPIPTKSPAIMASLPPKSYRRLRRKLRIKALRWMDSRFPTVLEVPVLVGKLAISNTMLKQKNSAVEVFVLILSSKVSVKKAQSAATSMSFQDESIQRKPRSENSNRSKKNAGFVYQARV